MTTTPSDFQSLLDRLPVPDDYSYVSVAAALRDDIRTEVTTDDRVLTIALESGVFVMLPADGAVSVTIDLTPLDFSQYPALVQIARDYATRYAISLESYYFHDTDSAMFGFGGLEDARQIDVISDPSRPKLVVPNAASHA